jgi:hypothetical protein
VHDDVIRNLKKAGIPEISQPFRRLAASLVMPSKDLADSRSLGISDVILTPACGLRNRKRHQENMYGHDRQKIARLSVVESSSSTIQHDRFSNELRDDVLSTNASNEEPGK